MLYGSYKKVLLHK